MSETEYHNSLIYPVEELYACLKSLRRNLMEDNIYQILTNDDQFLESRLSASSF
ncbi:hypothetical protein B296_00012645 [Ensete ventricosum]|uniref:Uncharacterized protein n=1 Tax=Ensete ventricosum TaxID=4639 RepID=A0A427B8X3_ENSVE|nr:hypothetical protein B296_00012645 [Ensete ventricosum]